jgi:hypothetical protein
VSSPEFTTKYGTNPSIPNYVDSLYQNVLGRIGEAEGIGYWNNVLSTGLASKAYVLQQFAASPEGAGIVAPLIANGIPYQEWVG